MQPLRLGVLGPSTRRLRFVVIAGAVLSAVCWTPRASAQVVQLPTFQFFSVQTTVMAPDSGRGYVAAMRRARAQQIMQGAPLASGIPGTGPLTRNRVTHSGLSAGGVGVGATIIDHGEWDRRVRGAAAVAGYETPEPRGPAPAVTHHRERGRAVASLSAIRRDLAREASALQMEIDELLEQAREAEANDQPTVARIYRRMAARLQQER